MTIKTRILATSLLALAAGGLALGTAAAHEPPAPMTPDAMTWMDGPPVLPAGVRITVLAGNPSEEGPFVFRLSFPAGYEIPAHIHSTDELVTVISGTVNLGHGKALDESATTALSAGGFVELPAKHAHFLWTDAAATVQIHGDGPFDITYMNPADDPREQ